MSRRSFASTPRRARSSRLGADPNALDAQRYDIITIAAVNNDLEMLKIALEGGGNARAITSPYDGTALIAAAHLGHVEIVRTLIAAKAPLNHVNNLGWTALDRSGRARQRRRQPHGDRRGVGEGQGRCQHPRPAGHTAHWPCPRPRLFADRAESWNAPAPTDGRRRHEVLAALDLAHEPGDPLRRLLAQE